MNHLIKRNHFKSLTIQICHKIPKIIIHLKKKINLKQKKKIINKTNHLIIEIKMNLNKVKHKKMIKIHNPPKIDKNLHKVNKILLKKNPNQIPKTILIILITKVICLI